MAVNVLFICADNATRSIMAEALLRKFGGNRFRAFSAGVEPAASIHPMAQEVLTAAGLKGPHDRPKRVADFLEPTARKMDVIIALAENADEIVRHWDGPVFKARWRIADPIGEGADKVQEWNNFRRTFHELEARVRLLVLVRHEARADPRRVT